MSCLNRWACKALFLLTTGLVLAGSAHSAERKSMRIVTAHLPPLVVEDGAERPGALYELVRELGVRMQTAPRIEFLPWPRAVFIASRQSQTAIFPLTRLPARETAYRWLVPLYDEHYLFLAPKSGRFDITRVAAMKDRRIAVIRGATSAGALRLLGYTRIVEARSVDEVHRFMVGGMADAAFGERAIVRSSLLTRDSVDRFDVSKPVYSNTAWLAGSLDFSEQDAAAFTRALQQMKADGSYQKILGKYGLE